MKDAVFHVLLKHNPLHPMTIHISLKTLLLPDIPMTTYIGKQRHDAQFAPMYHFCWATASGSTGQVLEGTT